MQADRRQGIIYVVLIQPSSKVAQFTAVCNCEENESAELKGQSPPYGVLNRELHFMPGLKLDGKYVGRRHGQITEMRPVGNWDAFINGVFMYRDLTGVKFLGIKEDQQW